MYRQRNSYKPKYLRGCWLWEAVKINICQERYALSDVDHCCVLALRSRTTAAILWSSGSHRRQNWDLEEQGSWWHYRCHCIKQMHNVSPLMHFLMCEVISHFFLALWATVLYLSAAYGILTDLQLNETWWSSKAAQRRWYLRSLQQGSQETEEANKGA